MTVGMSRLAVTRRGALLGAGALAMPYVAKAADPIRIGLLLAKTGQIAPQTEYLAQGTYLALEERGNKIMGQPAELVWLDEPSPQGATAEHAEAGAGEQGLRHPRRLAVVQRAGRGGDGRATEDPVRVRQRRGDRDHRQELQPLHVPAEYAGAGAIAHAGALCAGLWQEVVLHHRVVRVRTGHPAVVARTAASRRAAPRPGSTRCR